MRIVLDLQSCQSESRFRGIGRYSLSLAKAIARRATGHEVWLVLSDRFPESMREIRRHFDGIVPRTRFAVFSVPASLAESESQNSPRARAAERLRENFISDLEPDLVHLFSLFEGWVDDAVSSIGILDSKPVNSVTLYDLIPLIRSDEYLATERMRAYYYRKLGSLKNAELILTISESCRREAISALSIPENRIINVSAGIEDGFRPAELSEVGRRTLCERYGITRPFVFCVPGGFDSRKNIAGLLAAFASLPTELRRQYQLVIASKIPNDVTVNLRQLASQPGLKSDDLQLIGFVPESDLIGLYRACSLFVLPSLHEGFGLPALEALACGAPVIASDRSSLPEVIGWDEALFDPRRPSSIASALKRALKDEPFRQQLIEHGLNQARKFTWDASASKALEAFESIHAEQRSASRSCFIIRNRRPRLAFVSPLPPERTGIANYSAELLRELGRFYEIDLIVNQGFVEEDWLTANFPLRTVEWFAWHSDQFGRVLYQFGNSHFHKHMPQLLERIPGVVTLHDFFLSGLFYWMEAVEAQPHALSRELYRSHGYRAVHRRQADGLESVVYDYPCSRTVFDASMGTVVHSEYARQLAREWYGGSTIERCRHIPMLQTAPSSVSRGRARKALGIRDDEFVVCSFGLLDPTKLNHRLLNAWFRSRLAGNSKCRLFFVGENHGGEYGRDLLESIKRSEARDRILITGFESAARFSAYLAAADAAVQLRCRSRGETSRAVIDCLVNGTPTILNANGSFAEYPEEVLIKLDDDFADRDLVDALERLMEDDSLRLQLAEAARNYVLSHHHPDRIGEQYHCAIEELTADAPAGRYRRLIQSISDLSIERYPDTEELQSMADCLAFNHKRISLRSLFIDVSGIASHDRRTGTERVTRSILLRLLESPPQGFRVEPVYAGERSYLFARRFTSQLLELDSAPFEDQPVEFERGDVFVGLDWAPAAVELCFGQLKNLFQRGIQVNFVVYDILPLTLPHQFPEFMREIFERWLRNIAAVSETAVCISEAVAAELQSWFAAKGWSQDCQPRVTHFHLGADLDRNAPTLGIPPGWEQLQRILSARKSFLMVGTVEPRKGHLQTLQAFDLLWKSGADVNLVIAGKEGWTGLELRQRKPVAEIARKLRQHPEAGRRLHWLEDVSDEFLQRLYSTGTALIAASEGEGFGLPLVEASRHQLPIIARDLAVFREVAGPHAFYFDGSQPSALAGGVRHWLELCESGAYPRSERISWLTWEESTRHLLERILK